MSRRTVLALAFVVVCGLALVPGAQAADATITNDPDDVEITFGPRDGTEKTGTTTMSVRNDDVNESADVTITSTPSGVSVDATPETIEPETTEWITLEVTADYDASDGTVEGSVDGERFEFEVDVEQPPQPGFDDEPLYLGDVLVGESESGDVTVEEIGGDQGLNGVEWEIVSDDRDATLRFSGMSGYGGVSTGPGGEDGARWTVTVDDDVDQHEDLEWTVELRDSNHPDVTREVDVEARVIYPAEFGSLDHEGTVVFDEPRDENPTISRTVDAEIPNVGDLKLDVDRVTADSSDDGIDVRVLDQPDVIDGRDSETATLEVTADTDLPEGEYDLSVAASANNHTVDDAWYSGDLEIEHELELRVKHARISVGDVPIGETERVSTEVSEELGYQDIDDLVIDLDDGPDRWMTIERAPTRLDAGESEPIAFEIGFDPDAEQGTEHAWTYVADGDEVDRDSVTIVATPVPLDLGPIRSNVESHAGSGESHADVARHTLDVIDEMDEQMRSGEAAEDDISLTLALGGASTLYLEAMDEAVAQIDAGDHDEAQANVAKAAAAYNAMTVYTSELEDQTLRSEGDASVEEGGDALEAVIDEQAAHYETRLEDGDVSLLEEATIKRQLARVVSLQGDDERAETLQADADEAFERYADAVADGERAYQNAQTTWQWMEDEQFVSVAGQPLLLNPANYDAFTEGTAEMEASYEESITNLEAAGERSRADMIANEYEQRAVTLETTRLSLFGAIGVYGLVAFGIVFRTARGTFWYVRDADEAVSGDFLV